MGKVADEIPSHGFETAEARQALRQQKTSTCVLVGNHNELQILVARGHLNRLALHLTCLLSAPPRFHELVVAHNLSNAVLEWIAKLKQPACRGVGKLDESRCIGDQH